MARINLVRFLANPKLRSEVDRALDAALHNASNGGMRENLIEMRRAIELISKRDAISTVITPQEVTAIQNSAHRKFEERLNALVAAPIPELVASLRSDDWQDRKAAAVTIMARHAPETIDPLLSALIAESIEHVGTELARAVAGQITNSITLRQFQTRLAGESTTYLFTLEEAFRRTLAEGDIDDDLRDAFARGGVKLDAGADLDVDEDQWLISCDNHDLDFPSLRYSITDQHGELRVYRLDIRGRIASVLRFLECAEARPILEACLADPEPPVRAAAVAGLKAFGGPSAAVAASWRDALHDPDAKVRFAAVDAQASALGHAAANPLAKRLERETHSTVAELIIKTLGSIGTDEAIDALIAGLLRLNIKSRHEQLWVDSGDLLLKLPDQLWIDPSDSELEPPDAAPWGTRSSGWASDFHDALQTPLGRDRVLAHMRRMVVHGQDNERTGAALEIARWMKRAAEAKTRLHEEDSLASELLNVVLADPNLSVRRAAALALRWSGSDSAPHAVVGELGSANAQRRVAAVVALGRLGHEAAADRLRTTAREDPVPLVRILAARALGQIGFAEPLPDDAAILVADAALSEPDAIMRALARAALDDVPNAWNAFFDPPLAALNANKPDEALALITPRLTFTLIDSNMEGYKHYLHASVLIELDRLQESLVALEQANRPLCGWSEIALLQATVYRRLGRWKEAQETAQRAVDNYSHSGKWHALLGLYACLSGDLATSIRASLNALKIDRTLLEPRFNLALARLASGETSKAPSAYQRALKASHDDETYRREVVASARDHLKDLVRSKPDMNEAVRSILLMFANEM